ncbi:MAG: TerB family tellurite resistance protein [Alphaproteobacteria bacterium]|nr:TerB family tellurite resistance protein [Alphaproteobacteria bacterium]
MYNLYNPLDLTQEQKLVYIRLLFYLAKSDNNPDTLECNYIKKMMSRFGLSADVLQSLSIPKSLDDLQGVLRPIKGKEMAVDLIHCLWFAASVDSEISTEEIKIIRNVARILNVDEDMVLVINNFVLDEMTFMQQACEVLGTAVLAC